MRNGLPARFAFGLRIVAEVAMVVFPVGAFFAGCGLFLLNQKAIKNRGAARSYDQSGYPLAFDSEINSIKILTAKMPRISGTNSKRNANSLTRFT
jgi:hypothetical protein